VEYEGATIVRLLLSLCRLWAQCQGDDQMEPPLVERADRCEVFLARMLDRLDGQLQVLHVE
jgi:hypothetical protein